MESQTCHEFELVGTRNRDKKRSKGLYGVTVLLGRARKAERKKQGVAVGVGKIHRFSSAMGRRGSADTSELMNDLVETYHSQGTSILGLVLCATGSPLDVEHQRKSYCTCCTSCWSFDDGQNLSGPPSLQPR